MIYTKLFYLPEKYSLENVHSADQEDKSIKGACLQESVESSELNTRQRF